MLNVIKLVCSVCDAKDPLVTKTKAGLIVMCKECVELGVLSKKEGEDFGHELNIYKPETFKNKPATGLLYMHSYFKVHSDFTMH